MIDKQYINGIIEAIPLRSKKYVYILYEDNDGKCHLIAYEYDFLVKQRSIVYDKKYEKEKETTIFYSLGRFAPGEYMVSHHDVLEELAKGVALYHGWRDFIEDTPLTSEKLKEICIETFSKPVALTYEGDENLISFK